MKSTQGRIKDMKSKLKDRRKYECRDCGTVKFPHWVKFNRKNGLRCDKCGGILDPSSQGAVEMRQIGKSRRENYDRERGSIAKSHK